MRFSLLFTLILALLVAEASGATITIVNADGVNEGFNDPTPATPVGGNPGTTIGQQRLNVFQHAADIWGGLLSSDVEIRVQARFNPQSCDSSSAVLGSAGPIEVFSDFTGAEVAGVWYHVALANKQAGGDLAPSTNDISATFNSSIDNNDSCLLGTNWYYGLDGNEGSDVELLPVVLHELGHGLGFSTLVNGTTGSEFFGAPDIYETFLLDNTTGLHWDEMNSSQRVASAVNTDNLVWDGMAATQAAPTFLGPEPSLFINAPGTLPPTMEVGTATFGPALTTTGVTGDLVLVDDGSGTTTDACEPITNGAAINGNIALIDRGTCTFVTKVQEAQAAGAIGVVIANHSPGVITMSGSDPSITIPSVMVSLADGNALKAELLGGVNVTIGLDTLVLAGTDANGRVRMYAPNPFESGSSVSHWDTSANPSLLMEPAITDILSDEVDLTLAHFEDIGWFFGDPTGVVVVPGNRNALYPNRPNPFNPQTTISFTLAHDGPARLRIYDVAGRLVRSLVQASLASGPHERTWNGKDDAGRRVASGVYIMRLQTDGFEQSRRMLLLK